MLGVNARDIHAFFFKQRKTATRKTRHTHTQKEAKKQPQKRTSSLRKYWMKSKEATKSDDSPLFIIVRACACV